MKRRQPVNAGAAVAGAAAEVVGAAIDEGGQVYRFSISVVDDGVSAYVLVRSLTPRSPVGVGPVPQTKG